ncbi:MAG: toll/interleukin-1 receptor domain-containing protein, partial [Bryobacteraceae bacterium]
MGFGASLFISYSRKDYYFAESLAFHLLQCGVPVWLDVKDLRPGGLWERDLEAALDASSCFLLVASPESLKSSHVRSEWQRAKAQQKRIVIVLRRRARLPAELADCEVIDFRGAFTPALRRLVACLGANAGVRKRLSFWKLPPWILAIAITLVVPIADYFVLANWSDSSPKESAAVEAIARLVLPGFALVLLWFLGFSFLRRRMGMTHLLVCFGFTMAWTIYPLALFWLSGREGLAGYAKEMVRAITDRPLEMELLGALPLAGLF